METSAPFFVFQVNKMASISLSCSELLCKTFLNYCYSFSQKYCITPY